MSFSELSPEQVPEGCQAAAIYYESGTIGWPEPVGQYTVALVCGNDREPCILPQVKDAPNGVEQLAIRALQGFCQDCPRRRTEPSTTQEVHYNPDFVSWVTQRDSGKRYPIINFTAFRRIAENTYGDEYIGRRVWVALRTGIDKKGEHIKEQLSEYIFSENNVPIGLRADRVNELLLILGAHTVEVRNLGEKGIELLDQLRDNLYVTDDKPSGQ